MAQQRAVWLVAPPWRSLRVEAAGVFDRRLEAVSVGLLSDALCVGCLRRCDAALVCVVCGASSGQCSDALREQFGGGGRGQCVVAFPGGVRFFKE